MKTKKHNVLLAILGESPGVLTETLWGIAENDPASFPSEISIMTTRRGQQTLQQQFRSRTLPCLTQKLNQTFGEWFYTPLLRTQIFPDRENMKELDDLLSRSDVDIAGDAMLRWVRGYAFEENTRILASISGGRKSMTSLFTTCMTLLGKPEDRMFHVHVPPPYDRPLDPPFLFPGQYAEHTTQDGTLVSGSDVKITLIEMPFIPLHLMYQSYWGQSTARFTDMVAAFHKALDPDHIPAITLSRKKRCLSWDDKTIPLSETETKFLTLYWKTKILPKTWADFSNEMDAEDCRKAAERIRRQLKSSQVPLTEISRILPKFRGESAPPHWPPKGLKII